MKRLTTDSPKTNFSAMMNFAYAKNGEAYLLYADGEKDVNLAEYIATLARERGCSEITNTDVLDGACLECDCPIAVLNVAAIQAAELRARLEQYEDAESEGRLVMLPCKVGDTVYQLTNKRHARGVGISPRIVSSACVWNDGFYALTHQGMTYCQSKDLGKTWFLTKGEAEQALKGECK